MKFKANDKKAQGKHINLLEMRKKPVRRSGGCKKMSKSAKEILKEIHSDVPANVKGILKYLKKSLMVVPKMYPERMSRKRGMRKFSSHRTVSLKKKKTSLGKERNEADSEENIFETYKDFQRGPVSRNLEKRVIWKDQVSFNDSTETRVKKEVRKEVKFRMLEPIERKSAKGKFRF